jgi:hypothetical protein
MLLMIELLMIPQHETRKRDKPDASVFFFLDWFGLSRSLTRYGMGIPNNVGWEFHTDGNGNDRAEEARQRQRGS